MQAVKPEWANLQAQFTALALSDRILNIIDELNALRSNVEAEQNSAVSNISASHHLILRTIQRYVEWTVPELLPHQAEEAEILVDVARFAARLLIQEEVWNTSGIITEID